MGNLLVVSILVGDPWFLLEKFGRGKVQETKAGYKDGNRSLSVGKKRPSRWKFMLEAKQERRTGLCIT